MKYFSALTLLFFTQYIAAQKITGKVLNEIDQPITAVSVALIFAKDSSVVEMNITDSAGKYVFEKAIQGNYKVMATAVGYLPTYSSLIDFTTTDIAVPDIIMEKDGKQLDAVVVTTKRPLIEAKPGKMVVNVDASPTNTGLNALEVLEKSPGVTVDNDGNISIKGKSGVLVLIDGKPTYMSAENLANFLKSMQSSSLDQIEIMTNPPAKYDAAGNSGIINIKTKKGTVKGMNGNANLSYAQGFYPRYNGDVSVNYRNDKINIFGGYNGGRWSNKGALTIDRNFIEAGSNEIIGSSDQVSKRTNFGNYHNVKAGIDYNFSKKDVIGLVFNGSFDDWRQQQNSLSNIRFANGDIDYKLESAAQNVGNSDNYRGNLNYKHTFDSAGKELVIDVDAAFYKNFNGTDLSTTTLSPDDIQKGNINLLNGKTPSDITIYTAKIDYVHPFKKGFKLEAGAKTSFVNTDNQVVYNRKDGDDNDWVLDNSRTNHFIYKENINAAYTTLTKTFDKWEIIAGLRLENTIASGDQKTIASSFKRNYTNLFPNGGVSYNMNDKNQFTVSYSRRILRPDYDNLNPFVSFIDSLTYEQGNPYLQPQFTNNFEFSHTFNRILTTTINYTRTRDIITQLLKQNTEDKSTYQTRENFSNMNQLGVAVNANLPMWKWWSMNVFGNLFHNNFEGLYNDGVQNYPVEQKLTAFMANITNTFTISSGWNAELSGWYASKLSEGLMIGKEMYAVNSAVSKQILKKKGTIKIGVRDIFKTQVFNGYAQYANVDTKVQNKRDSRVFNISFIYKFGKSNIAPERKRNTDTEEQNRVKSGGNG